MLNDPFLKKPANNWDKHYSQGFLRINNQHQKLWAWWEDIWLSFCPFLEEGKEGVFSPTKIQTKQASNISHVYKKEDVWMAVCSSTGFVSCDLLLLEQRERGLREGTKEQVSLASPWPDEAHRRNLLSSLASPLLSRLITSGGQPRAVKCTTVCSCWGVGRSQTRDSSLSSGNSAGGALSAWVPPKSSHRSLYYHH